MTLTDQMREENERVRTILKILGRISDKIGSGGQVSLGDLGDVVELTEVLAQRHHQKKEEDLLLSAMEGSAAHEHGALALLLSRHSAIRKAFRDMKEAVAKYRAGDVAAKAAVSQTIRLYCELFSDHLETAESELYAGVDTGLSREKREELIERFDTLDRSDANRPTELQSLEKLSHAYLK